MPDATDHDEARLHGGCALGCVMAAMAMALAWLGIVAMLALAVGVGQTVSAVRQADADRPAITDQR